ncbi:protein-tyrosine-phosphatase [Fulvivirga sedimenti]|uniref:Protein-tyrosine-phosphatase n=1 Tax=Fulvivirga sedimenti TaxID=2879465 RepID=A0A9X1L292_9BACT|nr:protein-tyrosine-phosphatase [Fulvivirga sedimenti]MCA6079052.1 protein-tyrosine-phosphatase [Fulvivirga sedimenti]
MERTLAFYPDLDSYWKKVQMNISGIPDERKGHLDELVRYIQNSDHKDCHLVFICTHNSRRSHLSQLFAQLAAYDSGLNYIHTYSGGTEATALNPRVVQALERAGFRIKPSGGTASNPVYAIHYNDLDEPISVFSKTYDDPSNPPDDFAAVMTCSDAEENCPYIPGTSARISVKYEDPKVADGTPYETERYDERTFQIACEMYYVMDRVVTLTDQNQLR